MDSENIYQNVQRRNIEDTTGPRTQSNGQDKGKDEKCRGRRCLVVMTVCLGLICVLLLVFFILKIITITAERDLIKSYKNTVEELNQTINSLQHNYTDLMTEKDQLKNNFSSLTQKKLELETRVKDLTEEKGQLQGRVDSLTQKKLELERNVTSLSEELKKETSTQGNLWGPDGLFMSTESKSWTESRQYCRDRGADLVIINTEEKQRFIKSFIKETVWIGLTDIENEGTMKWVDNSPLKQKFFFPHEPNDAGGNEDCIEMKSCSYCQPSDLNIWNDCLCSESKIALCEK